MRKLKIFILIGSVYFATSLPVVPVLASALKSGGTGVKKLSASEIPKLKMDDADAGTLNAGSRATFKTALLREAERCKSLRGNRINFAGKLLTSVQWCDQPVAWFLNALKTAKSLQEIYARATKELDWYQSVGSDDALVGNAEDPETGTGNMLFTGYLTYDFKAKLTADARFRFPIYRTPENPKEFTRAQIEAGALKGKNLEIAFADNPLDPYLLHVQGSGLLHIDGQNDIRLKNTAQNGRAYKSLRKIMVAAGIEERFTNSMQGIREYFTAHPEMWIPLSSQNESYVFFGITNTDPQGAHAIVTPKHSIAVDPTFFPYGVIGIIHTMRPTIVENGVGSEWRPFAQFVIAQDTGGAIKSPGHIDIYYGSGEYAKAAAGGLKHRGNAYFFSTRNQVPGL